MKKYVVIGNPIDHSLSPKLHNYWIKKNSLDAVYEKKKLDENELKALIEKIRDKKIDGVNVTVPFKKKIIPFLDMLSSEAKSTQSVNTIYLENKKIIGHNTDIDGFEKSLVLGNHKIVGKKVFILGAGGVVPSIIYALKKLKVSEITVSNRTENKADDLKKLFNNLNIIRWGEIPNFDIVINATTLGLKREDKIDLDFSKSGGNKLFYDVIYNPVKTNFLLLGEKLGNKVENGKKMFIYQASAAFKIWHNIDPEINEEVSSILDND